MWKLIALIIGFVICLIFPPFFIVLLVVACVYFFMRYKENQAEMRIRKYFRASYEQVEGRPPDQLLEDLWYNDTKNNLTIYKEVLYDMDRGRPVWTRTEKENRDV